MQDKDQAERLSAFRALCVGEDRRIVRRGRGLLLLLSMLTAAAAALSFSLSRQGAVSEGELYRAVAFVEGFAEDHRALSVFLGLEEQKETVAVGGDADDIKEKADAYIAAHGG